MTKKRKNLADQLSQAKQWALKNLLGKKVYHSDIKGYIEFNRSGIEHAVYAKTNALKAALIYQAEDIIKKSTLFSIDPDKKNRPDIKAVCRFVSHASFEGKEYFVYVIVRETIYGKFYYDHGKIKEKP